MNLTFPDKYFKVAQYFDREYGDLELTPKLNDEQKLLFYALRQQAEKGPCSSPAPSIWYMRERYKHQAWAQLGSMTKFEAMVHFVKLVEEHLGSDVNWVEKLNFQADDINHADARVEAYEDAHTTPDCYDDDIRDHMEPNAENVRFLAREVMKLRCELSRLRACTHEEKNGAALVSSPSSPPKGNTGISAAVHAPPTKPKVSFGGNIAPPVRPSSLCMTEAALRNNRTVKAVAPRAPKGWAEWLGLS